MEITQIAFFIAVMFFVLALILALAWVARRYMGGGGATRTKGSPLRRRERRLALVEAASISPRHKLVLVRRDNVEHLLLLGGGNELVVESRITTSSTGAGVSLRDNEPRFAPPAAGGEVSGTPAPGPELSTSPTPSFPPPTYGAATAGNYEPSLFRRGNEDDGDFRDQAPDFGRTNPEPDYFASTDTETADDDRPSYLDQDEQDEPQQSASTYEKYRPPYGSALSRTADHEPGSDEDRGIAPEEDDDDRKQARVLSRFLRKDTTE